MKKGRLRFFFCLILLGLGVASCKDDFDLKGPNVDQFVNLLKSGRYSSEVGHEMQSFSLDQIEQLLFYSKDTSVLSFFPYNPISSKRTDPKVLGECILWTVEGIRLENKYGSLEPALKDTLAYTSTNGYTRLTGNELLRISDIYINWYSDYKKSPSDVLRKKDLLKNTSYKWE